MPTLFHLPTCGTCRKARAFLKARGVQAQERLIAEHPPTVEELSDLVARSGLPLPRWFNTSGESYRLGGWKDRVREEQSAVLLQALAADGRLIKRPVLDLGHRVFVGFDEPAWASALDGP